MKKAILILLVFGSAFASAWFLLKGKQAAAEPVEPEQAETEQESSRLAPEGEAVYSGSMLSSPTSSTSTTSTPTTTSTVSVSGRRTTGFTWYEKPETPFL